VGHLERDARGGALGDGGAVVFFGAEERPGTAAAARTARVRVCICSKRAGGRSKTGATRSNKSPVTAAGAGGSLPQRPPRLAAPRAFVR
jgi:hypothetical protein